MSIKRIAKRKYLEFSAYYGSQHIATEHALLRILELIKKNKVENILELGLGIGTIYSTVKEFKPKVIYNGTEDNDFCLNSLKENLKEEYQSLHLYPNLKSIKASKKFDLVIIDGKDSTLNKLPEIVKKNSIVIIEGDRSEQEKTLKKLFPKSKYVHIISLNKNDPNGIFESNFYQGGVKVFFTKPNISQYIYWMKNKIATSIKYRIRR